LGDEDGELRPPPDAHKNCFGPALAIGTLGSKPPEGGFSYQPPANEPNEEPSSCQL